MKKNGNWKNNSPATMARNHVAWGARIKSSLNNSVYHNKRSFKAFGNISGNNACRSMQIVAGMCEAKKKRNANRVLPVSVFIVLLIVNRYVYVVYCSLCFLCFMYRVVSMRPDRIEGLIILRHWRRFFELN